MLKLTDIVPIPKEHLYKYKIHFAIGQKNKKDPLYALYGGNFKSWQEYQNGRNFERNYILSLIFYNRDEWIFGGVFKQKDVKRVRDHYLILVKI